MFVVGTKFPLRSQQYKQNLVVCLFCFPLYSCSTWWWRSVW